MYRLNLVRIPIWKESFQAQCFSLQLDTDHPLDGPVRELVDQGCSLPLTSSGDWLETLRLVGAMDVVLTVDTAMAHLCGAVVSTVWFCLMPCDWRWGGRVMRFFAIHRLVVAPSQDQAMQSADR